MLGYVRMGLLPLACAALLAAAPACGPGTESCPEAQPVSCNGVCVNTLSDFSNCGGCGNACVAGQQCRDGECFNPCTPSAEICDGMDNDCDGAEDEDVKQTFYADSDSDNYGDRGSSVQACTAPSGYVANDDDCNDSNRQVNPLADEDCDGVDNDCDTTVDEGCTCTAGTPRQCGEGGNTGACEWGSQECLVDGTWGPCTGGTRPDTETCNGQDDDCDTQTDEGLDADDYENNETCPAGRTIEVAEEVFDPTDPFTTPSNPTSLYKTNLSADVDWFTLYVHEGQHICWPGDLQCGFGITFHFTPPAGADHTLYQLCVYEYDDETTCSGVPYEACTNSTYWDGTKYAMRLEWPATCNPVLSDSKYFNLKVARTGGSPSCAPYQLEYQLYQDGGFVDPEEGSCP